MPTYPFSPKTYRPSTTPVATDDRAEPSSAEPCAQTTTPPVALHPIALVQQTVADYLMVASSGIDSTQNFHDLGLDSQGAVEITTRLGRIIDQTLQPTLLFEYQTPVALAEYLEREHGADLTVHDPIGTPHLLAPRSILAIEAQESAELQVRKQDIAIIGMACRLPGADDLNAYWQLLRNGKTAITEVDPGRWSVEDYFDPDNNALHASYSKWGAFLNRPHEFDPLFFGVSPREAAAMDPQQRLFMAVVGGVYLAGNDSPFVYLSRVGALSPSGVCLPFDRRANGMVLGEGVSAPVLKPLREAMVDGDFIHAVIKGSAINNDGHSTGITAPNPRGQADAIRKSYRNAGVSPETVSYIECHGTGTPFG